MLFEEGVVNWFILYEFKFLLEIKSQQLEKAKETLDFILKHSRYKKVGPVFSEKWIIFEGYLIFITQFNNNKEFNFNYFKFITIYHIIAKTKQDIILQLDFWRCYLL